MLSSKRHEVVNLDHDLELDVRTPAVGRGPAASVKGAPTQPSVPLFLATEWVAALLGWASGLMLRDMAPLHALGWAACSASVTVAVLVGRGHYQPGRQELAIDAIHGLFSAVGWSAVVLLAAGITTDRVGPLGIALGAGLALVLGVTVRATQRSWLHGQWRKGRFVHRAVLVGTTARAAELHRVSVEHPEAGWDIVGVVGDEVGSRKVGAVHLGEVVELDRIVAEVGATSVLIDTADLSTAAVNSVIRQMHQRGVGVQILTRLGGISHHRLQADSLAGEAMLMVHPNRRPIWDAPLKRATDLVGAVVLLVVALPVMAAAAAAIKLEDRGPILYRQSRIGRGGQPFEILKMRSMAVDADDTDVGKDDWRAADGLRLKVARDPRVTRVGRVLRTTSIDELPQLFNVLRGDMSLVGPRPAVPEEHAQFDAELQTRVQMRPGITGLWQAQARDNEAFGPYRRLDLYYVHNWSLALDLSILAWTAVLVIGRAAAVLPFRRGADEIVLD